MYEPTLDTRTKLIEHLSSLAGTPLENLLEENLVACGAVTRLPEARGVARNARVGISAERFETPRWEVEGNSITYAPLRTEMISVSRDHLFYPVDPTRQELDELGNIASDYAAARHHVVTQILANEDVREGMGGLQAFVYDLRGTLRYNGFYLAEADLEGLKMLIHEADRLRLPFVGTVTSGTVSEGTNFMEWVNRVGYAYPPYHPFAICDSLTTAAKGLDGGP